MTGDCRLFRSLAENLPHGVLGLLQQYRHIAAPDACDGTSAVGESRHRIPGASVGQPTEPCFRSNDPTTDANTHRQQLCQCRASRNQPVRAFKSREARPQPTKDRTRSSCTFAAGVARGGRTGNPQQKPASRTLNVDNSGRTSLFLLFTAARRPRCRPHSSGMHFQPGGLEARLALRKIHAVAAPGGCG